MQSEQNAVFSSSLCSLCQYANYMYTYVIKVLKGYMGRVGQQPVECGVVSRFLGVGGLFTKGTH